MDVDRIEEAQQGPSKPSNIRRTLVVPVDDAHPFDLESYISNYSGHTFVPIHLSYIQLTPHDTHRAHGHRPPDPHPHDRAGNSGRGVPAVRAAHPPVARPGAVPEPAAGVRAARSAGGRGPAERAGPRAARCGVGGRGDAEEPGGPREA